MNKPTLRQRLFSLKRPAPTKIAPGLYHFQRAADGASTRFHLRVEPDGHGLLLANASLAARLSPAGVLIAHGMLTGTAEAVIQTQLRHTFRGTARLRLEGDLERVKDLLERLTGPGDNFPILNWDDAGLSGRAPQLIAPLNADVALAPPEQLLPLIARLWAVGIPHITFSAPEALDATHLLRAVERAEDTGLISGVRGRASDLQGGTLLSDLAQAGVDHVNVYFAAAAPGLHERLFGAGDHAAARAVFQRLQALEVAPVAEVPLVESTLPGLTDTLQALHDLGVTNVGVFAIAEVRETPDDAVGAEALPQAAALVEAAAHASAVRYIWQPPVRRDFAVSLAAQARRGPRCSDELSMRVEADGTVLPPRGPRHSAGNLLTDRWDTIWGDAAFQRYRERVQTPTRCGRCPGLAICAADCPREPAGWSTED